MDIKNRIRELMDERSWSEYRLCKESGLSQSTINNIFSRNNSLLLPTLEAVCAAFGLTLAQFFADANDPVQLTDNQRALLQRWISLTDNQRQTLLEFLNTI